MTTIPQPYSPAPGLLKGRVVLVTGANGGLGRAVSLAAAGAGATVVLLGRTVPKLEAVYDAIKAAGHPEPAIFPINLAGATWADYAQLAATLEKEFGRVDAIAHCAAYFRNFVPLADLAPAEWLESLQVNLTAPFALTRHCLPLLEASASGSVLLVSDACGRTGKAYAGAYGIAKFALEGLMQTWAQELEGAGRVRINTLDPGPLDTPLRRKGYADALGGVDPSTAANAALWLLGPDSRGVSGQALSLCR